MLSVLTAIVCGIPLFLLKKLYLIKGKVIKIIMVLLLIGIIGCSLYVNLTVAALLGVN
jgi:hypothetical protein